MNKVKPGFIKYYLPTILWIITVLVLTSYPSLKIPDIGTSIEDKLAHFGVYLILAFLMSRSLWYRDNISTWRLIYLSVLYCTLFAFFDEIHQSFIPGRSTELYDLLSDFIGILAAQILFLQYLKYILKKNHVKQETHQMNGLHNK